MVFKTKRGSSPLRRRLGARSLIAVSLCVALASVGGASIATGAPVAQIAASPLKIAKKALRIARGANKRSKQALSVANQALSQSGQTGPKGDKGDPGADGQSVTSAAEPAGANCADGGSKFDAANGTTYACNGADGADGAPGDPWTVGGILQPGDTETGTWAAVTAVDQGGPGPYGGFSPISFTIPLAAPLDGAHVTIVPQNTTGTGPCAGGTAEAPVAASGNLCVYTGLPSAGEPVAAVDPTGGAPGAAITGATVISSTPSQFLPTLGTWAVTG